MNHLAFARGLQRSSDHRGELTYIMYHGTTLHNARKIKRHGFVPSSDGTLGRGVYVSRSFEKASKYPSYIGKGEEKRVVLMLKVRVGSVIRIDRQGHPLQKSWHQAGYDTAWIPPKCGAVGTGMEEDCVWDPDRIQVLEVLNMDGSVKDNCFSSNDVKDFGPHRAASVSSSSVQTSLFIQSSSFHSFCDLRTISKATKLSTYSRRCFQSTRERLLDSDLSSSRIRFRSKSVSCLFSRPDDDNDEDDDDDDGFSFSFKVNLRI